MLPPLAPQLLGPHFPDVGGCWSYWISGSVMIWLSARAECYLEHRHGVNSGERTLEPITHNGN